MACEQSDKQSEEKFNSSMINSVACEKVFQCQPSGRKMIVSSYPVFQSDWQTATSCKTLQFVHIIHSTYQCRNMHKWYSRLQMGM